MLPDVGSTIVPPGCSRPSRSAASIIAIATRSFTLPPGFIDLDLGEQVAAQPFGRDQTRDSRTSGVLPTRSRIESATSIASALTLSVDGPVIASTSGYAWSGRSRSAGGFASRADCVAVDVVRLDDRACAQPPGRGDLVGGRAEHGRGLHARAGRDVLGRAGTSTGRPREVGENPAYAASVRAAADEHEPAVGRDARRPQARPYRRARRIRRPSNAARRELSRA